jgi:FKBP-type peptidyl-prolyl cis-trans isomerase FklB
MLYLRPYFKQIQMKQLLLLSAALLICTASFAQKKKTGTGNEPKLVTAQDTISYIIGTDIGGNFKKNEIEVNLDALNLGLKDGLAGNDSLIPEALKMAIMGKFQQDLQTKQQAKMTKDADVNKVQGKAFLDENIKKEGVKVTASGLQYKVLKEGTGANPTAASKVTVNYEGKLISGKIFDSSYERKQPATFPLSGVIKGWTEGVQLMKEGATYEFYIPSDLAYGDRGNQAIPGGSTLIFKVELIKIETQ